MKIPIPKLQKKHIALGILITLLVLFRIPSLFEPHVSGDEGYFAAISHFLHNGAVLYKDVWDDHPPGIHLIYFFAGYFGTLNLFIIKLLNLLFSVITTICIYKLSKRFFNQSLGLLSALFTVIVLGLPLLDPNTTHSENFYMFFSVLGIYNVLKDHKRGYFISGISFSVASLFDLRVFFIICSICIALILIKVQENDLKSILSSVAFFLVGLFIPWTITLLALEGQGSLSDFAGSVLESFLQGFEKESVDSLGFILFQSNPSSRTIIALILLLGGSYIFLKRLITRNQLFIFLWGISISYAVLFPQVNHNYLLLQAVPIFAVVSGYVVHRIQTTPGFKSSIKFLSIYILSLFFFLNLFSLGKDLFNTSAVFTYYKNFISYLTGTKDTTSYIQYFGNRVYDQYTLNSYLQQNLAGTKDIYLWTDNPWIMKISKLDLVVPYTMAYQANRSFEKVEQSLKQNLPSFIIIDKNSLVNPLLEEFLIENSYTEIREIDSYLIYQINEKNDVERE